MADPSREDSRSWTLVVREEDRPDWRVPLHSGRPLTVGRGQGCDLRLESGGISRRHCRLEPGAEAVRLVDLGSTNGTFVDGRQVEEASVADGQELAFGPIRAELRRGTPDAPGPGAGDRTGTHLSSADEGGLQPVARRVVDSSVIAPEEAEEPDEAASRLWLAYQVSRMLARSADLETVAEQITRVVLEATPAERVTLLAPAPASRDEEGGLAVWATASRQPDESDEVAVSRTVVDDVLDNGVSILSRDAASDDRFAEAESVVAGNIRSVACAPLVSDRGVLGVIYADSRRASDILSEQDLELIALVGSEAGVALRRQELRHQALHDPMTGLPNRALLEDRIEMGLARARRESTLVGVMMIDVDRFKSINDQLGHAAGDRVLSELAGRLREATREEDTVARWGGDEFVVVLPELEAPGALEVVTERLMTAARPPIEAGGESLRVGISVGAVACGEAGRRRTVPIGEPDELVRLANLALHRAKKSPEASFQMYDPEVELEGVGQIRREEDLRRGLEAGEVVPLYQPIVRLEDGAVVGFEALARWRHPERGVVLPSEFVSLAGELGLTEDLGETVIRQGCALAAGWARGASPGDSPLIGFNLSGAEVEKPGLAARLEGALDRAGLSPERVVVDVTEAALLRAGPRLGELRALGLRVFLDDFGAGDGTFSQLRSLEVDGLKIDMDFVHGLTEGSSDAAIVEAMAILGRKMGLTVVAEGIETAGQFAALRATECDWGQGFHLARPMPGEACTELFEDGTRLPGDGGA